ncbi:hypothetical protein [Bradyrhizobium lablabi]|uniref:hypothetical protein n=1 Tax=Bradyrhizobium lablabi TaxID=722472 RepID=UPI001BAA5236|nr:hypothetical protein [Bradyrhizobium lablabi]MBR0695821.1 hypothetical protein [Bradyrhizobium lablabi]
MGNFLHNPKHWRDRAEETRTKAARFYNVELKRRMLRIAEEYEKIADQAAELERTTKLLQSEK